MAELFGDLSGRDVTGLGEHYKNQKDMLFGNSSTVKNPDRNIVGLDSATESLMNQREDRANKTPEQLASEAQAGVQQDSGAAFRDQGLMNQRFGGADNPMSGAIANRQSRNYLKSVNAIKRQAEYQAPLEKQQMMQQVMQDKVSRANAAAGIADRDREQQLQNWQNDQNRIAARRKVINGLFATGGTVVGGYFGGAAGAKSGNQTGRSMSGDQIE